ncbi:hypothetical protein ACH5RR_019737 [Cinchona calisaya]|uniref:Anaphase-promoting complex subunit 4-like WD40 domain-containing protein n=1 Tax=Cinchona calisaya TaxID=153742 RepID=A0ABD2ZRG3_9GENT
MENMMYAEELVREFLVFRGFTNTLQSFEKELSTDIGKGFQVDKILDLIFSVYIPKFQAEKLVDLLSFFKQCFSSSETAHITVLLKLHVSILRYYIIYAIQSRRKDKVVEFFNAHGSNLLQNDQEWASWFGGPSSALLPSSLGFNCIIMLFLIFIWNLKIPAAIPYLKNPHLEPQFRMYFTKEWYNSLHLSDGDKFVSVELATPGKISSERLTVNHLKKDIKQLNLKLSELQALLEEKEAQLCHSRSNALLQEQVGIQATNSSSNFAAGHADQSINSPRVKLTMDLGEINRIQDQGGSIPAEAFYSSSRIDSHLGESERSHDLIASREADGEMHQDEDLPEVKVEFQETFLGHTSPISRCRFSVSGNNIASASVDGTVRIWTYDSSVSASRNATIYCGAEVLSLEWDCISDRLLLIGTADGGIKAWNVDAKRVVCDLNSNREFPSVLDIKCSPVEPIFVSASASRGHGTNYIDKLGFASLTVWNMRTWKAMTVLPLGKDPPAITSVCFNHNGKLLAAAATDGMIHMFDMSAGLQITGWPAHDSAISSVLFGSDETSIFSLGTDGKIFEWSLHNQGKVLWSRNCSRFCNLQNSFHYRHEMALDANGRRLLLTSNSVRAPIYQVRGCTTGMRTLPHSACITTVDWHPTLPIFLSGSADNSVRVTSVS